MNEAKLVITATNALSLSFCPKAHWRVLVEKRITIFLISISSDGLNEKDCKKESKPVKCFNENGPKRKRRNRSHFTQRQLQYLDKIFSRQQYLTRDERTLLARGLEMTELQIRNWFQNRRYQKRHRANEERKQDEPVTSVAIWKGNKKPEEENKRDPKKRTLIDYN